MKGRKKPPGPKPERQKPAPGEEREGGKSAGGDKQSPGSGGTGHGDELIQMRLEWLLWNCHMAAAREFERYAEEVRRNA